jgi:hypothetical protein
MRWLTVAAALVPVAVFAVEPNLDPARFELTTLVSGLTQPMELAVAPDGTVYWIEFGGRLLSLDPNAREPRLVGELTVTTAQENGLIGLALDPNFATNSHLYLQYSPPDFDGQHVSRFTLRDGLLDPAFNATVRVRAPSWCSAERRPPRAQASTPCPGTAQRGRRAAASDRLRR